jgi:hypothetical protein
MMNGKRLAACIVSLVASIATQASAEDAGALHFDDAAWLRTSADQLARCAGTYRGAAEAMHAGGREQAASYAEAVGSGALFAAYLLLTSPDAVNAKVLDGVDVQVHIEALAWGAKRNFVMMDAQHDPALSDALRRCTETKFLQSAVLQSSTAVPTVAGMHGAP